jgi:hypothetical protein
MFNISFDTIIINCAEYFTGILHTQVLNILQLPELDIACLSLTSQENVYSIYQSQIYQINSYHADQNQKGPKKEPFYRKNIIGFSPTFGQDYPGITPRPKITKILPNISIGYKLRTGFDSHALPPSIYKDRLCKLFLFIVL